MHKAPLAQSLSKVGATGERLCAHAVGVRGSDAQHQAGTLCARARAWICSSSAGTRPGRSAQATTSLAPVSRRAASALPFSRSLGPSSTRSGTPWARAQG